MFPLKVYFLFVPFYYHEYYFGLLTIHDSRRAQLKSKLLTGTYILQGNRAAFNQYQGKHFFDPADHELPDILSCKFIRLEFRSDFMILP